MIIKEEKEEQSNLDNFFEIKKEKNKTKGGKKGGNFSLTLNDRRI